MSKTEINQKDISNQVISMDKEYTTRDGSKVEILTTSRDHKSNVVALVEGFILETYTQNGGFYYDGSMSDLDLVEVKNIEDGLKQHDLVLVSDDGNDWYLRFFHRYDVCEVVTFLNCHYKYWKYCRKATPQEIIENKGMLK